MKTSHSEVVTFSNSSKTAFESFRQLFKGVFLILCFTILAIGSVSATSYGPYTATSGTVTNQSYDNGMSNTYLIQPSGGGTITLTWNSFNTEANYDYVTVYDGTSTSGTQLGRWSSSPSSVTATTGSMYITFTTDGSVIGTGWSANYSTASPNVLPGTPTSVYGTASGATTANIYWSAGSPVGTPSPTYYWVVSTSSTAAYGTGSWYGTGSSTSVSGLAANTDYYLRVYSSNSAGSTAYVTSSAFKTYPADPTSISVTSATVCNGTATTLTANGNQGTVYWYTGGCGSTQVATGNTYSPSPSSSTTYYARNNNGNWSNSCASTTITVNALPAISSQSTAAQTICLNGTASALTVSATGAGLTYQWYSHTSPSNSGGTTLGTATGARTSSYTPLTTSAGTKYYYCVVGGTCTPLVTSAVSGAITINAIPVSGTLTPNVAAGAVCSGTSLSATLTAGSGGAGTIADVLEYKYDSGSWTTYTSGTALTATGHTSVAIRTYRTASASGCTSSTANTVTWTVNALPTLAAITGTTSVCIGSTTTLANSQAGGTWSSASTAKATVHLTSGLVTSVAAGTSVITYSYTNVNGCTNSVTTTVTVIALPATPSSVTATPSSVCANATSNLNATSTDNLINWYTASTGGTLLGSSASGANYAVTPASTTTYYAEAVTTTTSGTQTLDYSGAIVNFTVPAGITSLTIDARGAQGGSGGSYTGGLGARIKGDISVTPGQVLKVLVGQKGGSIASYQAGGGGGGTFITTNANSPLIIAGGGSGGGGNSYVSNGNPGLITNSGGNSAIANGGTSGAGGGAGSGSSGGGGLSGDGTNSTYTTYVPSGGKSFINGGAGGAGGTCAAGGGYGGFGGGSGGEWCSQGVTGAGGGYSGGAGANNSSGGAGAGGSYNSGTNKTETSGSQTGNGQVIFTWTAIATSCPSVSRTAVTVTTNTPASAGTVSGTTPLNGGATATYSVSSVTLGGGTGAWSSSNTNYATVNATTGLVTAVAGGTCNIIYTVTGGCGGTVTAQQALTVNALPSISSHPSTSAQSVGLNGSATNMTITASAGSGTITNYTWYKNTSNANTGGTIVGGSSAGNTPATTATGTLYYYCVVTNSNGGTKTSNVSGAITVYANPTISAQPATGGQSIALNGSATALTITAAAGSGSISTYQWYKNTSNANTGGTTVGTNAASYTPITTTAGTLYYYCVVTNSNTGAITSNISGAIVVYAIPAISTHPSTSVQNICQNGTSTDLTITASAGSGTISGYQWYKNASNANTGGTTVGTSAASYTPLTNSAGALYYYCVVTNSNGGTLTSNVSGKITIAALPTVASAVTASPTAVCSGAAATLNATSTGNSINWYTAATGGTNIGTSASGANFVVNPTQATTYYAEAQTISSSSGTQTFNYTGTIDNFTVPAGVTSLVIEAKGAQGGTSNGSGTNAGGKGAYIKGTVTVTPGQVLKVLVGGQGGSGNQGGGGGGSFVTTNANAGLVIAGGGGGGPYTSSYNSANSDAVIGNNGVAGTGGGGGTGGAAGTSGNGGGISASYNGGGQGAGGGGLNGNGTTCFTVTGGKSFTNGGAGGVKAGSGGNGGFGGGGGADWSWMTGAGGGGGYSGGGGGTYYGVGGGGGSYNAGTSQTQTAGYQTGNGQVVLTWTVVSSASCPAASRTAVTVGLNTSASVASVTGSAGICVGSTSNYTANTVVLAGGTGAWSSSNTAVATVVASTGVASAVAAGSCNIVYTITNGCGGTVTSTKAITVSALPVLAAITGTTTFCKLLTTTLANTTAGGTWSSASTGVATVDASSGVVTGVTTGTSVITYTYTNGGGCTNSISTTVTVTDLPTNASSVAASPSTVLSGSATNLNATSTSNTINWYTAASGGTSIGSSASGANYSVTPSTTTTYYAEAVSATGTNGSQTFSYTGAQQTLTVPAGVTAVSIETYGAQGGTTRSGNGNLGGKGAYAKGNLAVTPGQTLYVYVGGQGGGAYNSILEGGGWNGGGHSNGSGDGGGGATDVRVSGSALSNRVIVAGGGGGNGWYSYVGGDGGGLTGSAGGTSTNSPAIAGGGGGTQSAGGTSTGTNPGASGALGVGGNGGRGTSPYGYSGGGGAGYYGGAGGAGETGTGTGYGSAGGGGSSYVGGVTNATTTAGSRSGNGQVIVSWLSNAISCPSETRTAVTVTVNSKPTVTTTAISAIASTTATGGGNVTADGGATVTARGICWSTSQTPTVANTTNGTGTGTFTSSITGLTAGTTYYVRAYATNAMGTSYGNQVSFKPYTLGTFANINKTYGNAAFVLVNPTSTSTGTFSYESSNTNVATIVGNTVTIVGAGSSTITCTQAGNSVYATASKTATLTVAKANQVLTLNPMPSSAPLSTLIGTPQLITASSSAGLTVIPSIASGPATVTFESPSYYLTPTGTVGTAVVQVNQAGNDNYNAAQITHSIDVTKGNQTITFAALSAVTYANGLTVDLTASSSSELTVGLAVVSGPATISGNTLTITGAGTVVITASQSGNSSWNAATDVTRNLTVNKAAASITFEAITKTYGDADFSLNATSASSGAFSYSSGTTATATVSGNTATIEGAGTSTITVNQAASADYTAGSTTALLTVDKADQTISIDAISDLLLSAFEGAPIQITATSTSGLTVALTVASGSKATINGSNQAESTNVSGSVTINANQAGDDNYNAATQATEVFAVNKASQTVTFAALADKFSCDDAFELTATSTSALEPTFASSNELVATVSGTTVTIVGTGNTTITAAQTGNAYFSAASSVGRVLTVTACVAPTIAATTAASSIGSTTASSGGNVTADGGGAITERGICWSTLSNPTTADDKSWGGTGTGIFEGSLTGLTPNTLYYVRAYATNSVNTVYGTQVSFTTLGSYTITAASSNPITGSVTGGGSVDAGASISVVAIPSTGFRLTNWTEDDVEVSTSATYTFTAGADRTLVANFGSLTVNVVDPKTATVIENCTTCDVTVQNTGTLTVDASNKEVNSVTVEPGGKLILNNPITVQDLTLKADNSGSFSTTVGSGMTVTGAFRYIKSMDDVQWYFISFPCNVSLATGIKRADGSSLGGFMTDWEVYYYDGEARISNLGLADNWKQITTDHLVAYKGYIMGLRTGMGTVDVAFTLDKDIINQVEGQKSVPVTAWGKLSSVASNHKGWNLVGQPYLSKFSGTNADVEYMLFPSNGGQTYDVKPKISGKMVDPFTAYFVQANATLEGTGISFDVAGRQAAPSAVASDITDRVDLNFNTVAGTDKTGLVIDSDKNPAYIIGEDMEKWMGTGKPQVYTLLGNVKYAYNGLPMSSVVDLPVGVYTPSVGPAIISADATGAPGLSQLLLTDKTTGTITDLLLTPYNYIATAGTTNTRFVLNAKRVATDTKIETEVGGPSILINNYKLIINNLSGRNVIRVFDAVGRMLVADTAYDSTFDILLIVEGVYTIQIQNGLNSWTKKVVYNR